MLRWILGAAQDERIRTQGRRGNKWFLLTAQHWRSNSLNLNTGALEIFALNATTHERECVFIFEEVQFNSEDFFRELSAWAENTMVTPQPQQRQRQRRPKTRSPYRAYLEGCADEMLTTKSRGERFTIEHAMDPYIEGAKEFTKTGEASIRTYLARIFRKRMEALEQKQEIHIKAK
jgi:hypothetical protein